MTLCPVCKNKHGQIFWKDRPPDFNEFPRCKKCESNHDYTVELTEEKTNTWKVKCECCLFTETKKHARAVYINGELVL